MAEHRLHDVSQLAECAMVLDDLEIRVVAKAAAARGLEANPPMASARALAAYVAARVGQYRVTRRNGRCASQRQSPSFSMSKRLFDSSVAPGPENRAEYTPGAPSSASTARPLSSPSTHWPRCLACSQAFSRAFSANVVPVSSTSIAFGKSASVLHSKPKGARKLDQLQPFLAIVRAEDEKHGETTADTPHSAVGLANVNHCLDAGRANSSRWETRLLCAA